MKRIFCALLLASSVVIVQPAHASAAAATANKATKTSDGKTDDEFDMAQVMAVFDKLFPAQREPVAERLALSRVTVKSLFPDGTYSRLMDGMMASMVDRVLDLSEVDFGKKGKDGKPPSTETLRQKAMNEDPHFEERMRITQRVLGEEFAKMAALVEPRMREGLARSMARRFDERQLTDINGFLATDSGRAFGAQSMSMWVDPDVMRAMMGAFPEMFDTMPAAMKRLESETAHLPKPKKEADKKTKKK